MMEGGARRHCRGSPPSWGHTFGLRRVGGPVLLLPNRRLLPPALPRPTHWGRAGAGTRGWGGPNLKNPRGPREPRAQRHTRGPARPLVTLRHVPLSCASCASCASSTSCSSKLFCSAVLRHLCTTPKGQPAPEGGGLHRGPREPRVWRHTRGPARPWVALRGDLVSRSLVASSSSAAPPNLSVT